MTKTMQTVFLLALTLTLFLGCKEKNNGDNKVELESGPVYQERGLNYALSAKAVLGKNLIGAIKAKGTKNAVGFCNEKAFHLTDSVAVALNVHIKRVSDKPRNPKNMANKSQLDFIKAGKQLLAQGQKITPQLQELDGKIVGYYPIVTNAMCLQCHGKPDDQINKATQEKLANLYPKDKAKGYAENELRGIWVIEMDKE
jgi:Protein of unknown function (DUF3365)